MEGQNQRIDWNSTTFFPFFLSITISFQAFNFHFHSCSQHHTHSPNIQNRIVFTFTPSCSRWHFPFNRLACSFMNGWFIAHPSLYWMLNRQYFDSVPSMRAITQPSARARMNRIPKQPIRAIGAVSVLNLLTVSQKVFARWSYTRDKCGCGCFGQ